MLSLYDRRSVSVLYTRYYHIPAWLQCHLLRNLGFIAMPKTLLILNVDCRLTTFKTLVFIVKGAVQILLRYCKYIYKGICHYIKVYVIALKRCAQWPFIKDVRNVLPIFYPGGSWEQLGKSPNVKA